MRNYRKNTLTCMWSALKYGTVMITPLLELIIGKSGQGAFKRRRNQNMILILC